MSLCLFSFHHSIPPPTQSLARCTPYTHLSRSPSSLFPRPPCLPASLPIIMLLSLHPSLPPSLPPCISSIIRHLFSNLQGPTHETLQLWTPWAHVRRALQTFRPQTHETFGFNSGFRVSGTVPDTLLIDTLQLWTLWTNVRRAQQSAENLKTPKAFDLKPALVMRRTLTGTSSWAWKLSTCHD